MVIITKEVLCSILKKQGFANTKVGQNLYSNLLPLTEQDFSGPEVKDLLLRCRDRIAPTFDIQRALLELEII